MDLPAVSGPAPGAVLSPREDSRSQPRRAGARRRPDWALLAPPAVTLGLMLWGTSARPYWGDEADTVSAVTRSLPQLIRMLGHIDAVHGLYYLLLWPIVQVAGPGEIATRMPSVAATTAAAFGVTVIGRKLRSRRAGLWAGLVFAVLPEVTVQAHDARPYAMVIAVAVLACLLLVRAAEHPGWGRLAAYGLSIVVLGYLDLLALVLVPAHLITLLAWRRWGGPATARDATGEPGRTQPSTWPGAALAGAERAGAEQAGVARAPRPRLAARWLLMLAAVGAVMAPLVVLGWLQRVQIAWITRPTLHDVWYLIVWLTAGPASAWAIAALAVHGGWCGDARAATGPPARPRRRLPALAHRLQLTPGTLAGRRSGSGLPLTLLTVPWLVLPPVMLMAVSEARPIYSFRYVIFCLPAVALLVGAGLAAAGRALRAAAFALIVVLALPTQLTIRAPGLGVRSAAQLLATSARPGDAIIYPGGGIPPWYLAYPWAFRNLREISMAESGAAASRLYGLSVGPEALQQREQETDRVWALELQPVWHSPGLALAPDFRLVHRWSLAYGQIWLALYQRTTASAG